MVDCLLIVLDVIERRVASTPSLDGESTIPYWQKDCLKSSF